MVHLRAVNRGRLRQVAGPDGLAVDVALYGCQVVKAPAEKNGKVYMTVDITACTGDTDLVRQVDSFIDRSAKPSFSPLMAGERLVVKLPTGVKYENDEGNPAPQWALLTNSMVDIVIRPGAFGAFGYCWLLQRIKPAKAQV